MFPGNVSQCKPSPASTTRHTQTHASADDLFVKGILLRRFKWSKQPQPSSRVFFPAFATVFAIAFLVVLPSAAGVPNGRSLPAGVGARNLLSPVLAFVPPCALDYFFSTPIASNSAITFAPSFKSDAARFSRKCPTDEVPGISKIFGDRCNSQASATCIGVAPNRSAISLSSVDCSGENPPSGK